ncbi:MAG: hypothetical protein ACM33V_07750 [Chloroflexota bacterium]|nr:hypothetical protein [Anaerolineales bacterium]
MLTLAAGLYIPAPVLLTAIGKDAVLLNTSTSKYYSLNQIGVLLGSVFRRENIASNTSDTFGRIQGEIYQMGTRPAGTHWTVIGKRSC